MNISKLFIFISVLLIFSLTFLCSSLQAADISGTVYGSDGSALTGISIEITAYQTTNPCLFPPRDSDPQGSALSDPDTGAYTITDLQEGDYYVNATDASYNYTTEYWNGDPDDPSTWICSEGESVSVSDGETVSSIDFKLELEAGTITGRVTDSDTGSGISDIDVLVLTAQCVPFAAVACTDSDGYYTINGLPLGESLYLRTRYWLLSGYNYINIWYGGVYAYHCEGAQPVDVEETTTIDFELETGETITGRVTDLETGLGISDIVVRAWTAQCDGQIVEAGRADADGYYTIYGLPSGESYYLGTSHPPILGYNYVNEWYENISIDACDDATQIVVPSTGINFELDVDSDGDGMSDDGNTTADDDDDDDGGGCFISNAAYSVGLIWFFLNLSPITAIILILILYAGVSGFVDFRKRHNKN